MRPQGIIIAAILLCVGQSGCRMYPQIARNIIFETCLFNDELKGKVYYCMLANSAWKSYQGEHPDCSGSKDYAKGFKRGYSDYLQYGGCCCLPRPLPPQRYLKVHYETPEGRAATVAWQDGFRAGEMAAKASGYRELIIVPIGKSNYPPGGAPPMISAAPPLLDGTVVPGTGTVSPAEELPAPRSLPEELPLPPPSTEKDKR